MISFISFIPLAHDQLSTVIHLRYFPSDFHSQFSLVFNLSGDLADQHADNSDESVSEEVLSKVMECVEDETSLYINDDEFSQVKDTLSCILFHV